MSALVFVAAVCQVALAVMIAGAALHLVRSGLAAWWWPIERAAAPAPPDPAPRITVQIPLRNERAVAERVMRAACALDWPAARLDVQVLDDSDDDTRAVVDRVAAELCADGHAVTVVRRDGRDGYKAGALAHGLAVARGDLLLLLDADSVPDRDLARRLAAPLSAEPSLAFAQGRWGFDNERASLLTRAQALILDGLMLVEQPLLHRRGMPVQFNGTAGMWRRSVLEAAGGWRGGARGGAASVAEDLDLSYRARLAGHLGRTLPDVLVRTELPHTMAAFRAQQQRWVRGGAEVLRALAVRLARGKLAVRERLTMIAHLARHARQPLLVAAAVWLPLSVAGVLRLPLSGGVVWPALVAIAMGAIGLYYGAAMRRRGRSPLAAFAMAPVIVMLSMGMSVCLTVALGRGLFAPAGGEFVRTPKSGAYRAPRDALALVEVALGVGSLAGGGVAIARGDVAAGVTLAVLVAGGLLWVGLGSLVDR